MRERVRAEGNFHVIAMVCVGNPWQVSARRSSTSNWREIKTQCSAASVGKLSNYTRQTRSSGERASDKVSFRDCRRDGRDKKVVKRRKHISIRHPQLNLATSLCKDESEGNFTARIKGSSNSWERPGEATTKAVEKWKSLSDSPSSHTSTSPMNLNPFIVVLFRYRVSSYIQNSRHTCKARENFTRRNSSTEKSVFEEKKNNSM